MANHDYTRPGGVWNADTNLLAAELADLDAKTVDSISGTGGVYVLADDLEIGGVPGAIVKLTTGLLATEAVQLNTTLSVNDTAYLTDDVYIGSGSGSIFQVNAGAEFVRPVTFGDGVTLDDALTVNGFFDFNDEGVFHQPVDFNQIVNLFDELNVSEHAAFGDDVYIAGALDVQGTATLNGQLVVNGNVQLGTAGSTSVILRAQTILRQPMLMQDSGAIVHRVLAGTSAQSTYSPLTVHEVVVESGVLTASSTTYWLDDTGCTDGNEILFSNKDATNELKVRLNPSGPTIQDLTKQWVRLVRIGGTWKPTQLGAFP